MPFRVPAPAVAGLALAASLAGPAAAAPQDPSGTFRTEDGRARIRVERCGAGGAQICGYVVWMLQPKTNTGDVKLDARNPDPSRRARPILGHQLMVGLKPNGDESFGGQIYNNEDGKSYDVTVWLASPSNLKVKGCLVAFLCSTQDWTRTADVAPGQLAGATGAADGPQPVSAEWASRPAAQPAAARSAPRPRP